MVCVTCVIMGIGYLASEATFPAMFHCSRRQAREDLPRAAKLRRNSGLQPPRHEMRGGGGGLDSHINVLMGPVTNCRGREAGRVRDRRWAVLWAPGGEGRAGMGMAERLLFLATPSLSSSPPLFL